MKYVIIGTAGHIDHGKTTLIRALTGHNTDTLPEEIKRGISINLGFTYFNLPGGIRAGIVDVPGHERFIKNMIAGACGIDIALLTVASTEGVKPQTLEHAEIITFLGIKEGIIVMTKCDLADEILLELATDNIREKLKGTLFEDKEIVKVDSLTGYGLAELTESIGKLAEKTAERNGTAAPRLNIDRAFTKKGFGTVVTGTLVEGKISVGDELCVYHYGNGSKRNHVRVKSIQIHEESCPFACAGQRTALNISGVKTSELQRGDVLAVEDSIVCTSIVDSRLTAAVNSKVNLKIWDRLRVYLGSKETFARFVPYLEDGKDSLQPGESCFCQLRFETEVYVKKGDPFVVRRYSPMETVGGGEVLDPVPAKRRKADSDILRSLSARAHGSDSEIVEGVIQNTGRGIALKALATLASLNEDQAENALQSLQAENKVVLLYGLYYHINVVEGWRDKLVDIIAAFHAKFALKPGIPKEELRSKAALDLKPKEFDALLGLLCGGETFMLVEGIVSLGSFKQKYSDEQIIIRDKIEKDYLDAGYKPLAKSEVAVDKASLEVFESMVKKTLIPLDADNFIHISYMDAAKVLIREWIIKNGGLTLAEFRDLTASNRRACLPILEYLDGCGFTKRAGESRVLGGR